MIRRPLLSPVGLRLAAAFVVVAISALGLLVVLLLGATRVGIDDLVAAQHATDAQAAAAAAAEAYRAAGGWEGADLTAAAAIAARGQARLLVRDTDGTVVAAGGSRAAHMMARMHGHDVVEGPRGDPISSEVVVDGTAVGAVELAYPASGLPLAERQVRDSLSRVALLGGLVAVAVAVAVAVFVARRVTRPLLALTAAAARLEVGHRDARVTLEGAPGEFGELAAAFDRMAATLEREDQLRRQLIADVAHELRTPLTILRGTTEALLDGILPPDTDTVASLHGEVLRLTGLVGDLETLAAADAEALTLQTAPVDLADVATDVVALATPVARDAQIRIETDLARATVHGDVGRLRQITTNLLANALAYTPRGGEVIVTTAACEGQSILEISDTGPGLAPGEPEQVFERFFRGTAARDKPGSGIGLAVAAELVEAHHGTVRAGNRADGPGAVFTITLPEAEPALSGG